MRRTSLQGSTLVQERQSAIAYHSEATSSIVRHALAEHAVLRIIDELEPEQRQNIYAIIDMAVANNRLKKTLTNALNTNF